jgi:hypothetical protein
VAKCYAPHESEDYVRFWTVQELGGGGIAIKMYDLFAGAYLFP